MGGWVIGSRPQRARFQPRCAPTRAVDAGEQEGAHEVIDIALVAQTGRTGHEDERNDEPDDPLPHLGCRFRRQEPSQVGTAEQPADADHRVELVEGQIGQHGVRFMLEQVGKRRVGPQSLRHSRDRTDHGRREIGCFVDRDADLVDQARRLALPDECDEPGLAARHSPVHRCPADPRLASDVVERRLRQAPSADAGQRRVDHEVLVDSQVETLGPEVDHRRDHE